MEQFDFVIIGSGFGGAIMAMVLRRLGYSVALVERGRHPRFVIGESSTPLANLLLEKLAHRYDLPVLRSLAEWGTWQRDFPNLPVGLKRGFSFYHHRAGERVNLHDRKTQLLVAASANDRVADTHWYRPEFDRFLLEQARLLGARYYDETNITELRRDSDRLWKVKGSRSEGPFACRASVLIDATGPNSVLARRFEIPNDGFELMPPTRAVFAHFRKVPLWHEVTAGAIDELPYCPDDAAVHHVFDGGWIWMLRFNNGITSAGAALRSDFAEGFNAATPEERWSAVLDLFPSVRELFKEAERITPVFEMPALSFRRNQCAGENWAMLPSAAGFVDPLLSTGFALNLLGITRLGESFAQSGFGAVLGDYERQTFTEMDAVADLVSALYAKMHSFDEFARLSLLYFAALSFTETAWRLNKPYLAPGFLLSSDPEFTAARQRLCQMARSGQNISHDEIAVAISRWDIAGLTDRSRHNWYPVRLRDLVENRAKVSAEEGELRQMIEKAGLLWPL